MTNTGKRTLFPSRVARYEVGRLLAEILRRSAPQVGLTVDKYGFVRVTEVVRVIKKQYEYFTADHLFEIVSKDAQNRFQLNGDYLRARAGHCYEVEIPSPPERPPTLLFHGTSAEAAEQILTTGLKPMDKCYVSLTDTHARATIVGKRKSGTPVLLRIDAASAHKSGIRFWRSGQVSDDGAIWLSDEIPPSYISKEVLSAKDYS